MVALGSSSVTGGGSAYDPMKAVKRLHLELIQRLDISRTPHHALSTDDVDSACDAAKALRNRIIREYERVRSSLQKVKQRFYSFGGGDLREAGGGNVEGGVDDEDGALPSLDGAANLQGPLLQQRLKKAIAAAIREDQTSSLHRGEFLFLGELHMVQRVLVPVLVTHALHHAHTLLPQLLKLLAAMTLPILGDAPDATQQQDVFNDIRTRCSSDEFFVLLIHAVAPVASLRKDGPLPGGDAILLEVVLNIMSNLLQGSIALVEPMVGAMCRNHGVELVLVLLTQNFEKFQALAERPPAATAAAAAQDSGHDPGNADYEDEEEVDSADDDDVEIQDAGAYAEALRTSSRGDADAVASSERHATPTSAPEVAKAPAALPPSADLGGGGDSLNAIQRNETQLVVLPDSQYEAYLEQRDEGPVSRAPESRRCPPGRVGELDEVILYTDGGEALVVGAPTNRTTALLAAAGATVGETGRGVPPSCFANEEGDDGIDIDFNAPPPPPMGDDDAHSASTGNASDEEEEQSAAAVRKQGASSDSEASAIGSEDDDDEEEEDGNEEEEEEEEEEELMILDDDEALIDKNPRLKELAQDLQRETLDTLRRWNDYLLEIVALVFRCAPAADVSMLALSLRGNVSIAASIQTLQAKVAAELQRQTHVDNNWRLIAKSRNGAFGTNSILVRKMPPPAPGERERRDDEPPRPTLAVLGATSSLMMGKRVNALDFVKEQDRKKKGRFQRKMLEPAKPVSVLPLPTQIHLAQQFSAFLAHGFERISTMLWPNIHAQLKRLDAEIREMCEVSKVAVLALDGPMISPLQHIDVKEIMNYFFLCSTLLRFTRENLQHVLEWRKEMALRTQRRQQQRQASQFMMPNTETIAMLGPHVSLAGGQASHAEQWGAAEEDDNVLDEEQQELLVTFEAQWKAVSHIITLDHIQAAFTLMSNFTINKELAAEYDVSVPIGLVAELVLLLVHLLDGDIVQDASVTMAAHAMGSSLLYREENIQTVYRLIGQLSFKARPSQSTTQPLVLMLHALLTLIEKCSFNGSLALPKKAAATGGRRGKAGDEEDDVHEASAALRDGLVEDDVDDDAFLAEEDEDDGRSDPDAEHTQHNEDDRDFIAPDGDVDDGASSTEGHDEHRVPLLRLEEQDDVELDGDALVEQMRMQDLRSTMLQGTAEGTSSYSTELQQPSTGEDNEAAAVANKNLDDMNHDALGEDEHSDAEEEQRLFNALRSRSQESEESASVVLSSRTGNSSFTSEREVQVQDFYIRLATPKYIPLLYFSLATWRSNDVDTNLALAAILDNFLGRSLGISSVFNFPFLLIFHEILTNGYETHRPLYDVADRIVYMFFNPAFAKARRPLFPGGAGGDGAAGVDGGAAEPEVEHGGAMSSFGSEVAFRCTRALFMLHPSHYMVLEDAGALVAVPNFEEEEVGPRDGQGGVRKTKRPRGKTTTFQMPQQPHDSDVNDGDDVDEHQFQLHVDQPRAEKKSRRRTTNDADDGSGAGDDDAGTRRHTRRTKSNAAAKRGENETTMAYVMGSADVTALAKEVDRKERRLKAQAKRQPRRKKRGEDEEDDEDDRSSSSSEIGEEGSDGGSGSDAPLALRHPNTKAPKKKKHRVDDGNRSRRNANDGSAVTESPHTKKQRKRQEKKREIIRRRNELLGIPNADGNGDAAASGLFQVGSIITNEDGATYMVRDDGFAYQVVVDSTTGNYVFVDDNGGAPADEDLTATANDGGQAEEEGAAYRREEDARIAALQAAQLIDAPHAAGDGTPSSHHFTSPSVV